MLFSRKLKIPVVIKLRVQDVADVTGCYLAFDADGTCWIYPKRPKLVESLGKWEPVYRVDRFQCEEIKFTKKKYRYSDWKTLFIPKNRLTLKTVKETYNPTREL